jgi:hypothetical protein
MIQIPTGIGKEIFLSQLLKASELGFCPVSRIKKKKIEIKETFFIRQTATL